MYGPVTVAVGDRVICRSNERDLDVDNGTRGTVRHTDPRGVVLETDAHTIRELPAAYVAEHVEHAYALTGHGMQGATVEQATVVADVSELTRGWSYTALSRARGQTRLLVRDATRRGRRARGHRTRSARPRGPNRKRCSLRVARRMLERDDEDLAIDQLPARGAADDPPARDALRHRRWAAPGARRRRRRTAARDRDGGLARRASRAARATAGTARRAPDPRPRPARQARRQGPGADRAPRHRPRQPRPTTRAARAALRAQRRPAHRRAHAALLGAQRSRDPARAGAHRSRQRSPTSSATPTRSAPNATACPAQSRRCNASAAKPSRTASSTSWPPSRAGSATRSASAQGGLRMPGAGSARPAPSRGTASNTRSPVTPTNHSGRRPRATPASAATTSGRSANATNSTSHSDTRSQQTNLISPERRREERRERPGGQHRSEPGRQPTRRQRSA